MNIMIPCSQAFERTKWRMCKYLAPAKFPKYKFLPFSFYHKCFKKGRHREYFPLELNVAKKTAVNLGFPFLWGLFLHSECEMAIFPISVMRK